MSRARTGIYGSVAAMLLLLAGLFPASTAAATTLTFAPIADAHVTPGNPNGNYGALTTIRTRQGDGTTANPIYFSYLTFDVAGTTGASITSVTLRLYVTDATTSGQGVHRVPDTGWTEAGLTYANAPAFDAAALVTATAPTANVYVDLTLPTSAIAGDGKVSFALKSTGTNSALFASREVAANPPRLVIVTADPTPTPTPTDTPIPTPTDTPIPSPSPSPSPTPSPSPSPSPTPTSTPVGLTLTPIADAHVSSLSPTGNYGALVTLRTREDPNPSNSTYRSYLLFDITGTGGNVQSVVLRVYVNDSSTHLQGVYAVSNTTWTESTIRYQDAPPIVGSPLASATGSTLNTYLDITLPTSAISGDGRYTFALKSSGTNSFIVNSKEATTNRPQLVINGGGTPPPPPVPVSAFDSNPQIGPAPLTVALTDRSTNTPTAWSWSFGDPTSGSANTSTLQNPSHSFANPGSYIVSLTASNAAGPGTPVSHTITVQAPGGSGDPVLVGAGDIANCSRTQDEATATLLDGIAGTVFTAGDNVYENGTSTEFANCYGPTWGRHKSRTKPVVGNHEYQTPGASGYYNYFGAAAGDPAKGYYSFNLGAWHAVVLNSNCSAVGGCGAGSTQERWLRTDLAANPAACTIAIWHHSRFTSTRTSPDGPTLALWQALYDHGAEIVVTGHQHNYERFAPQTPAGAADATFGIRQFVVGTGGAALVGFNGTMANSQVRSSTTYGVLKLTLRPSGYDFAFVPIAGQTFSDGGSASCHGTPSAAALTAARAATASEVMQAASRQQAVRLSIRHRRLAHAPSAP